MTVLERAKALEKELKENRRWLHEHAEVGFALSETKTFVKERLAQMGYEPVDCGRAGVIATLGKESSTNAVVLRADMDALPIPEKSGEKFACKGGYMHACGHDMHTAMLLSAARILKERERELRGGKVRFLFQPAEEILEGAEDMLKNGAIAGFENGVAFALHVAVGTELSTGKIVVPKGGVGAFSADFFRIEVKGKGCHGATPEEGVDALGVGARIALGLEELIAREIPAKAAAALTIGKMTAGSAGNAIADEAVLLGTLRAEKAEVQAFLKKRLSQVAKGIAGAFRARANVKFEGGSPALINDENAREFALKTLVSTLGEGNVISGEKFAASGMGGSEDFAYITQKIPSVIFALGAGGKREGYDKPLHHPKVKFDEGALVVGAAALSELAAGWILRKKAGK